MNGHEIKKIYEKCPYNEHLADIWVEGYLKRQKELDDERDTKLKEAINKIGVFPNYGINIQNNIADNVAADINLNDIFDEDPPKIIRVDEHEEFPY